MKQETQSQPNHSDRGHAEFSPSSLKKQLDEVEHLVRNWVNDSPDWADMSVCDMVSYALREEESEKIAALKKLESVFNAASLLAVALRDKNNEQFHVALTSISAQANEYYNSL